MSMKLLLFSCVVAVAYATRAHVGLRLPPFGERIVGGTDAKEGEFPHQVSVQWGYFPIFPLFHICGGTILNVNWIMTAAHCPYDTLFGKMYVKAGKYLINRKDRHEQRATVKHVFIHPKYSGKIGPFDIALLKLEEPLLLNNFVQSIDLPKVNSIPEGRVTLSGWGSVSGSAIPTMPSILQKVELPIISFEKCKEAFDIISTSSSLDDSNICTGPLTGGFSACVGDSGGPLIQFTKEGTPEVVGIVSWGIVPCGTRGAPSVYTRVSAYIDWIVSTMTKHS